MNYNFKEMARGNDPTFYQVLQQQFSEQVFFFFFPFIPDSMTYIRNLHNESFHYLKHKLYFEKIYLYCKKM
jgi:hypothetical protein